MMHVPPRHVLTALAIAWCAAFPLVGLLARLHLFADGALFAYAVAAGDAWAFHWRQIPGRVAAFAYASLPGEAWGGWSGDPAAGVAVYAGLTFLAPALGLAVTWLADRGGVIRLWAALSVVVLCPVVFGFPTELWITQAAIWPALALAWFPGGIGRRAAAAVALGVVVLSHEAGVIWAGVLLAVLVVSPAPAARRALPGLALALVAWAGCKLLIRPDPYVAEVLGRNAWNLFRLASLGAPLVLTMLAGLAVYAAALALRRGPLLALGVAGVALALWWLAFDRTLHGWDRYYLRTLLLGAVPVLLALAGLHAAGRLALPPARALVGALLVVTLVHVVETAKFVVAWRGYVAEIRVLAAGGDGGFVSVDGVSPLAWNSTTPFLSVMVSPGYAPHRLVVDPAAGYFWFDCATATANATATHALPAATREMVRRYACLHR